MLGGPSLASQQQQKNFDAMFWWAVGRGKGTGVGLALQPPSQKPIVISAVCHTGPASPKASPLPPRPPEFPEVSRPRLTCAGLPLASPSSSVQSSLTQERARTLYSDGLPAEAPC